VGVAPGSHSLPIFEEMGEWYRSTGEKIWKWFKSC